LEACERVEFLKKEKKNVHNVKRSSPAFIRDEKEKTLNATASPPFIISLGRNISSNKRGGGRAGTIKTEKRKFFWVKCHQRQRISFG
jgi:hypothetical protein